MKSMLRGLKHLVCAVLLLIAALCAAEVGLRAQRWSQQSASASLRAGEFRAVPSESLYEELPSLGKFSVEGANGQSISLETNSLGLRGADVQLPKPQGVFRILCLGDETTIAAAWPESETYPALLQDELQQQSGLRVECVNAGLPHGCPLTACILLRQRLLGLDPDLILIHVGPDAIAHDREIRPHVRIDQHGFPLVARHPAAGSGAQNPLASLSNEFVVVDRLRQQIAKTWPEAEFTVTARSEPPVIATANDLDGRWPVDIELALEPLQAIKQLAAGVYCEVIVTSFGDPLSEHGATHGDMPVVSLAGDTEEPGRVPAATLAGYAQERQLLYLDAARQSPSVPGGKTEPATMAAYAAAQARFIVETIPGAWSRAAAATDIAAP